jgi:hypothetical protein
MKKLLVLVSVMMLAASLSFAQGTGSENVTLNLTVAPEATITLGTTAGFGSSTTFSAYTTNTPYTYSIRTTKTGGSGSITVAFGGTDWSGTGGPKIVSPPTASDYLSFTSTATAPATAATGSTNIVSTSASYTVATFGTNALGAGITGNQVNWSLVNDPLYAQGSYSITATFTISAL